MLHSHSVTRCPMDKYYGQFDPPVDKFIFQRYFPNKDIKGTSVECGAFDGLTECSCKFFEESMGWQAYNFEPVPWIFEKLCANRPQSKNMNFALSDREGDATFKAVIHPHFGQDCTNGSLQHTQTHSDWLQEIGCTTVDVGVKLTTWRDFVAREKIHHVDLFVLDVEGHELSVLEGMRGAAVLPDIICVEVGHLLFDEVRAALAALGYVYDITSNVNAFFIRRDVVSLFALRRCDALIAQDANQSRESAVVQQPDDAVVKALKQTQEHIHVLEATLAEIHKSKGWRLIEWGRRVKSGLLRL